MVVFGELEERIRTLYEASTRRWPSERILDAANDGLDELSEATGFYERSVSIQMGAKQTYYDLRGYVPDDAVSISGVFNVSSDIWLTPVSVRGLTVRQWERVEGSPRHYVMRGLFWLGVYPRNNVDGGFLRVHYTGLAPWFVDAYSALADLPDDHVEALEDYVMSDLSAKDRESEKSLMHWTSYLKREAALRDFVANRVALARHGKLSYR